MVFFHKIIVVSIRELFSGFTEKNLFRNRTLTFHNGQCL